MLGLQIWYILPWSKPHPLVFKWREPDMIQYVAKQFMEVFNTSPVSIQ